MSNQRKSDGEAQSMRNEERGKGMVLAGLVVAGLTLAGMVAAGCATSTGTKKAEGPTLRSRVDSLESQLAALNQRVEDVSLQQQALQGELRSASAAPAATAPARKRLSTREIQRALAAAGYYKGTVDGKEGRQTKKAIREFQSANGLRPDGVVGRKTAEALQAYLPAEGMQEQRR